MSRLNLEGTVQEGQRGGSLDEINASVGAAKTERFCCLGDYLDADSGPACVGGEDSDGRE